METDFVVDSPYVGLQPYRVEDHKYFFGRARDSRIIASNLSAIPLTILYGASGVGKSSVLQAGVIPLLRDSPRTAVASFQRWPEKDPVQILKKECLAAIHTAGRNDVQVDTSLPLDKFLWKASQDFQGTILIILDQFEEYFLYHHEVGSIFDAEFARAVNREDIDSNFLIAMREDSLSMLDRFRTRIPNLLGNTLRLRHLDEPSAQEAIREPLRVYSGTHSDTPKVTIDDSLVDVLIKEVRAGKLLIGHGGQGGFERNPAADAEIRIEAPFLQLVLTRLWNEEMRQGSRRLRLETLNALGGAKKIVQTHLDHVMHELPPKDQEIAANVFRYLVTPSGTKIAYAVEDLAYYAKSTQPETLEPVLDQLAHGSVRILRRVTLPGEPSRYEIYHDVLAPAILGWLARYENDKELAKKQKELDQELAKKLAVELGKARERARKQRRILYLWLVFGVVVDFIWSSLAAIVPLLGLCLAFLPLGGWVFTRGLRKLEPPLNQKQIRSIILGWFISRVLGGMLGTAILYGGSFVLGLINPDYAFGFDDLPQILFTFGIIILSAIFFILTLASGPVGGLVTYGRIRRQQERISAGPSASAAMPAS